MEQPTKPAFSSATDGSVLVEAALVIPLLLAFVFGVEEYGRLFLSQSALQRAAYAAARCAAVFDATASPPGSATYCPDAGNTNTRAGGQLLGLLNSASVTFTVTFPATTPSCTGLSPAAVTVNASYTFNYIVNLPALLSGSGGSTTVPLTASATYPVQWCS
jgi:Flp pilus assembly protein TadG